MDGTEDAWLWVESGDSVTDADRVQAFEVANDSDSNDMTDSQQIRAFEGYRE